MFKRIHRMKRFFLLPLAAFLSALASSVRCGSPLDETQKGREIEWRGATEGAGATDNRYEG
jgi:hypothetical protein